MLFKRATPIVSIVVKDSFLFSNYLVEYYIYAVHILYIHIHMVMVERERDNLTVQPSDHNPYARVLGIRSITSCLLFLKQGVTYILALQMSD